MTLEELLKPRETSRQFDLFNLVHDINLDTRTEFDCFVKLQLIGAGKAKFAIRMLDAFPNLATYANSGGETSLYLALARRNTPRAIIYALFGAGADPYRPTTESFIVPLWQACNKKYKDEVILTLLTHTKTNAILLHKKNNFGNGPLKSWKNVALKKIICGAKLPRQEAIAIVQQSGFDYTTAHGDHAGKPMVTFSCASTEQTISEALVPAIKLLNVPNQPNQAQTETPLKVDCISTANQEAKDDDQC